MTETQNHGDYLTGKLLLALPGMGDDRFDRAVIALFAHNDEGAFGIDLGHVRQEVTMHDLLEDLGIDPGVAPDCPVHNGGPVEPQRGFVLHSPEWNEVETMISGPLCSLSASLDVLRAIAEGRGPRHWLIALGYSGWGAGQLDHEMHFHGWHAATGHAEVLWDTPAERRWTAAWRAEGIDPALLTAHSGHV
ncbi:MAG: YqgE/AlgH family protein [Novosphingobium sp.]